jgi:hypothetical protein
MKKFLSYMLLCIYLVFSTGWNIHLHYCGGSLAGLGFSAPKIEDCCGKQLSSKPNKCCKDEVKSFKSDENQRSSGNLRLLNPVFAALVQTNVILPEARILAYTPYRFAYKRQHAPPNSVPLYLRNCVFTI